MDRSLLVRGALAASLALAFLVASAEAGRITGHVRDASGRPAAGVKLTIIETGARATSREDGTYAFEGVDAGSFTLEAEHPRLGYGVADAVVKEDEEVTVDVPLDLLRQHETVVISASPDVRGRDELYQAANVLEDTELARNSTSTLGETLARQPGVHSGSFGPGASRPVIRGLGGERVRVMTNGIDVGDASTASPDHAVSVSPFSAERIEVIRGPATLMYGSQAIGGAVNILDNRIPAVVPDRPVSGTAQLRGASVADEIAGAVSLDGGGRQAAWHLDGFRAEAGDVDTPAGVLENTQTQSDGLTGGVSWVGKDAFVGVAASRFESSYGSPIEEEVTLDLEQTRYDLKGEVRNLAPGFRALRWRAGRSDYEHVELEGDEVGTRFLNDTWEARIEGLHGKPGVFNGSIGVQHSSRDFAAIGEESFVPPTETRTLGGFVFEELELEAWKLQLGARWETRDVECEDCTVTSRSFDGISASVGFLRSWENDWSFSASITRSVRHPGAEELFANGPHLATGSFERGEPGLDSETSKGVELGLRHHGERWHFEASAFSNWFDGFIRESATGEIEDDLPVFQFAQGDARTWGGELAASVDVLHREPHHLRLEAAIDLVETEQDDGGALPRTPPLRGSLGLRYQGAAFWALLQGTWVDAQDDVDLFETETDGYSMLDASFGWRLIGGDAIHDVIVSGTNLTDELAENHVSFLKDITPYPGRGVALTYRVIF